MISNAIIVQKNRAYKATIIITDNNGDNYTLKDGEELKFGVKQYDDETEYIIYKSLSAADLSPDEKGYNLALTMTDTNINVGYYHYDVAIQQNGQLTTVIPYTDFVVKPSIVRGA